MAWFSRFTRFGDIHLVYAQEAENSCGIACVMMTVFKINKLVPGAAALHKETEIYDVYGAVSGAAYDGSAYSYATHLASVLNRLRVGTWEAAFIGATNVSQAIIDSVGIDTPGQSLLAGVAAPAAYVANQLRQRIPIIVLVGWNAGGAHFVVVDVVNNTPFGMYASVCDPWDGNVHITQFQAGASFNYIGAPVPMSWDLGGTRHDYSSTSAGAPNGWVVRRIGA
ncbi:hypothetical protein [Planctellipticum variicoloris]|uniref:hypothetical protein n=1 Tax=Planctellipticum variicoloris TaxID=3064265 RepID=UPI0030138B60|nr:hypothetical protein SH412_003050 [Planctomycetaceae bacterium SH412]